MKFFPLYFSSKSKPCPSNAHLSYNLPPGHPEVNAHKHDKGTKCDIADATGKNAYCPPQEGDSRAVCPALNAMANHGFIPRDGKNLTGPILVRGLRAAYGLSLPLATLLAYGGFFLVHHLSYAFFRGLNLYQFCEHKPHLGTEHDASLVHGDTPLIAKTTEETEDIEQVNEKTGTIKKKIAIRKVVAAEKKSHFPPMPIITEWVVKLLDDISPPIDKRIQESFRDAWEAENFEACSTLISDIVINAEDIARARIRREKESLAANEEALKKCPKQEQRVKKRVEKAKKSGKTTGALDLMHTLIAQGEVAIILAMWERVPVNAQGMEDKNGKKGVPLMYFLTFLQYETLPSVSTGPVTPSASGTTTAFSTPASTQSKGKSILSAIPFLHKTSQPSLEDEKHGHEKTATTDTEMAPQAPAEHRVQWTPTRNTGLWNVKNVADGIGAEMGKILLKAKEDAEKARNAEKEKTSISSEP